MHTYSGRNNKLGKFYPAVKKPPEPEMGLPCANDLLIWSKKCATVRLYLSTGQSLEIKVEGMEEDEDAIYGLTLDGLNVAVPMRSVVYAIEGGVA